MLSFGELIFYGDPIASKPRARRPRHPTLRDHCATRGIGLIGDILIFLAHDSADVWQHQSVFSLDETGQPEVIAGALPDSFSKPSTISCRITIRGAMLCIQGRMTTTRRQGGAMSQAAKTRRGRRSRRPSSESTRCDTWQATGERFTRI